MTARSKAIRPLRFVLIRTETETRRVARTPYAVLTEEDFGGAVGRAVHVSPVDTRLRWWGSLSWVSVDETEPASPEEAQRAAYDMGWRA